MARSGWPAKTAWSRCRQGAGGHRHRRGDPGLTVEEGGLADQVPGLVHGQDTLLAGLSAEEALDGALQDVVELVCLSVLEVDHLSRRKEQGRLSLCQWGPYAMFHCIASLNDIFVIQTAVFRLLYHMLHSFDK